jgi:hypothetical protein
LEELWLLDRAKARLIFFIRSIMEQNLSFVFDIKAAGKSWEIENQDDLDVFIEELAGLTFMPPQNEKTVSQSTGEMYVFSTACDTGLSAFLLVNAIRPVNLFLAQPEEKKTQPVGNEIEMPTQKTEAEILRASDFYSMGCTIPSRWLTQKKLKPLGIQSNKTEMFYAGIRL